MNLYNISTGLLTLYLPQLTTISYVESWSISITALKYGLQPKTHSKKAYHPERIYVLSDKVKYNDIQKYKEKLEGDIIIKIDLSKTENDKLKLYVDPDSGYVDGFYCENFILCK